MIPKSQILTIILLVVVSPIFGVVLADITGYHEPLDLLAETLKLEDKSRDLNWTPLYDYAVPGLDPITGYVVSGIVGVSIIISIGYLLKLKYSR